MNRMLNRRIACLALSFSFLLLALGCIALEKDTTPADPLTRCTSSCDSAEVIRVVLPPREPICPSSVAAVFMMTNG